MICVEHLINYFFHGFQSICPPYSHTCTTRFILVSARNHFDHVRSPHSLINLTQVADSVQRCSARWKSATQRSSTDKPTILEPAVDELCQHVIGGGELPECKSSWTREELGWLDRISDLLKRSAYDKRRDDTYKKRSMTMNIKIGNT